MLIRGKRNINKALILIEEWSMINKMGVNKKKCGIMKLAKKANKSNKIIKIRGK